MISSEHGGSGKVRTLLPRTTSRKNMEIKCDGVPCSDWSAPPIRGFQILTKMKYPFILVETTSGLDTMPIKLIFPAKPLLNSIESLKSVR